VTAGDESGDELTLEYAVLENEPSKQTEITSKMRKMASTIHAQFRPEVPNGRIEIKRLDAKNVYSTDNEEALVSWLESISKGSGDGMLAFPDLVFLDNNIPDKPDSGKDALKVISERGYPLDSILYTELNDAPTADYINPYGRNWSTPYSDITAVVSQAMTKFYLSWSNPEYVRGLVLSRFADLDIAWNDLVISLLQVNDKRGGLIREFALTRDGLDITRKAKNAVEIAKVLEGYKTIDARIRKSIESFKGKTLDYAKVRDDFAHNPITKLYDGNKIVIRAKDPPEGGYTRNAMKNFYTKCTGLIVEIEQVTSGIKIDSNWSSQEKIKAISKA
jgi:hypothetical protein